MNKQKPTIGIYGIQDIVEDYSALISHDHGLAVMNDGKVISCLQTERISRIKHCNQMPELLYDLLKEQSLITVDANWVFTDNVIGRSFINSKGNLRFEGPLNTSLTNRPEKGKTWWLNRAGEAWVLNHELAHLGSCLPFYGPFKENSLLVHYDGGASLSNFSAWLYKSNQLTNLEYHWNLKPLTSLFNANALLFGILGAKQSDLNSVPGKLMGFASYGTYRPEIEQWMVEHHYFEDCWKSKRTFFNAVEKFTGKKMTHLDQKDTFIQDIAATVQAVFVRESLSVFKRLKKTTGVEYLYYSGGSALNIVLNSRLVESGWFKSVFVPPCCNDSGLALGAAAFFEWFTYGQIEKHSPYLNNWRIPPEPFTYTEETLEQAASLLLQQKVIGICNGTGEIGPRALGNRSIISLASSKKLARKVSMEHKQREWYRPVAPIMLEKNTRYFTSLGTIDQLSKYMLLDFNILPEHRKEIEGVVHVDGTSRIQTLFHRDENPFMFDLLTLLDSKYKIRALINTSFNRKGEPIVHTEEDAKKSALAMNLDALIINGQFVSL